MKRKFCDIMKNKIVFLQGKKSLNSKSTIDITRVLYEKDEIRRKKIMFLLT